MGFTIKEYVGYDVVREMKQAVNKGKKKPNKKTSTVKKNDKKKTKQ